MVLEEFEGVVEGAVPIWDGARDGPRWVEFERMALASPDLGMEVNRDGGASDEFLTIRSTADMAEPDHVLRVEGLVRNLTEIPPFDEE